MTSQALYLGQQEVLPQLERIASGKVRDIYALGERQLLFVTTDRVSAFDVVMNEGIPHKGAVLTAIAAWWFEHTRDLVANHLVSTSLDDIEPHVAPGRGLSSVQKQLLRGRIMIVQRAVPTSVEWVVRGYVAGSGWKDYQKTRAICGIPLPAGLQLASRLPKPILTPTTKDAEHDLPLTPDEARERVGGAVYDAAEKAALALFQRGTDMLAKLGILLADTKFEFGMSDGKLLLIDEALTPDSSRFWPASAWKPGTNPPSYDKQLLRDWLETLDWNKRYPPPAVDPEILARTSAKYLEICRKITGRLPEGVAG